MKLFAALAYLLLLLVLSIVGLQTQAAPLRPVAPAAAPEHAKPEPLSTEKALLRKHQARNVLTLNILPLAP